MSFVIPHRFLILRAAQRPRWGGFGYRVWKGVVLAWIVCMCGGVIWGDLWEEMDGGDGDGCGDL